MSNSFSDLGVAPPILKALEEMGFEAPTEVQDRAIPHILNKEDLIVMSKTGSGKTAVFGVSILQLTDPSAPGPQGLILTPTRELAVQVDSDLKQMSKYLDHQTAAVYGQHNMNIEIQALKKGVSILTGTPGRVFDHISHGTLPTKHVRFLVLDEADRMLDMGFYDQVVRIIRALPRDRVTLLFSATIPAEIRRICQEYMKDPATVEIESQTMTVDTIQQVYYRVERNEKRAQLNRLLLVEKPESCMIFCNTKIAVDQVQSFLARKGYASQALHGDVPQAKRLRIIDQFKQNEFHLLVATDVAARGIHVDNLSLVVNYDVPVERDGYVHRIGRTGRAGNGGRAVTLVTSDDIMSLYEIEEHIGAMIEEGELPSEAEFGKYRAEAAGWIQANALKVRPVEAENPSEAGRQRKPKPARPVRENPARPAQTKPEAARPARNRPEPTKPLQAKQGEEGARPRPAQAGRPNPPRPYDRNRRPAEAGSDHRPDRGTVPAQAAARPASQPRPPRPVQSRPPRPAAAAAEHGKQSPAAVQKQDTTAAEKPLIKRILQRIKSYFG